MSYLFAYNQNRTLYLFSLVMQIDFEINIPICSVLIFLSKAI